MIKVLLFAANPRGSTRLDLPREFREIDEEVRRSTFRDEVELILVPGARPVDLLRKLNESLPQVVHFSLHGSPDQVLMESEGAEVDQASDLLGATTRSAPGRDMKALGGDGVEAVSGQGQPQPVRGSALAHVLQSCNEGNLKLVVLNACDTRPQAEALVKVVDCVVTMNRAITDRAAIKFAASFYGALAFGRSVQKAFDQGVARLQAEGLADEGAPELLVRGGLDASRVVLVGTVTGDGGVPSQYFAVQREVIDEHLRHFIGRVAITEALERFLDRQQRGYFVVCGAPGQGKTAVACHWIKSREWPHHLVSRTGGRSDVRLIMRSLMAQLCSGMGWSRPLPDSLPELAKGLEDLLRQAAAISGRVVLILDALDELAEEVEHDPPFLITDGLPQHVYVVVTARPGDRLDRLIQALHSTPHELHELGPLESREVTAILRERRPGVDDATIALAAKTSRGNPLFLRALADELDRNPDFDTRNIPGSVEGFFRRVLGGLDGKRDTLLADVLGLLATARRPLTLRELSQIAGASQREIHQRGIRQIRQFLIELQEGYSFYHARFHEFVTREMLYEDELLHSHASLAAWLCRPECLSSDYRYLSLAYHLEHSGNRNGLWTAIEPGFLREKVRRFGYSVLEDVVLLARDAISTGDASGIERCVALVEDLREVVGGDLIDEARLAIQGRRMDAKGSRDRIEAPEPPRVPGIDLYIGMLPKASVGADFVEAMPRKDSLFLALGDAPGVGLKGAFVARFVSGLVRRLAERPGHANLGEMLEEVDRTLAPHPFFDVLSLQVVAVDLLAGTLAIAGAGHPHPVLYSARRSRCDRLPVGDDLLLARQRVTEPTARRRQRHVEIEVGDVLVMVSDGLTEGHAMAADPYGYRFERLIPALACRGARVIGESILEDWLAHSERADYIDDVTVIVLARSGQDPTGPRSAE